MPENPSSFSESQMRDSSSELGLKPKLSGSICLSSYPQRRIMPDQVLAMTSGITKTNHAGRLRSGLCQIT